MAVVRPQFSPASGARAFLASGHWPTLLASFLYFDFCFAIWVLNGAMGPFISETFHLSAAQKGFMLSVPILAGALMRFPLGVLSQYIGRKNAALVEMGLIVAALAFGWLAVDTYDEVILMGVLLGIAGASFGVALSLGSGWFPPKYKARRASPPSWPSASPCSGIAEWRAGGLRATRPSARTSSQPRRRCSPATVTRARR